MEFIYAVGRAIFAYILLLVLTRLLGRKLLAQMTFFDFIIAITVGTITGAYIVSSSKGLYVLISPIILVIMALATGFLTLRFRPLRKIVGGEPVVVIQNGKILENNMKKMRYNFDELLAQLRQKGVFDLGEVEFAVLERTGSFSVLKKSQNLPVTPKDLKLSTEYKGLAAEIIIDGDVIEQNLKQNQLSIAWLYNKLYEQGVSDIKEVALASLNPDGTLFLDYKQKNELDYVQEVEDKVQH